jgi:hypothetical protein
MGALFFKAGAMSAMAFMVNPVKPNVGFISTASSGI